MPPALEGAPDQPRQSRIADTHDLSGGAEDQQEPRLAHEPNSRISHRWPAAALTRAGRGRGAAPPAANRSQSHERTRSRRRRIRGTEEEHRRALTARDVEALERVQAELAE